MKKQKMARAHKAEVSLVVVEEASWYQKARCVGHMRIQDDV